jgi:D-sedoheptulose 7-phosphate isomerase
MDYPLLNLFRKYPDLEVCSADIQHGYDLLRRSFAAGGKLLVCGNGGSAADSEHIVGELMKGYLLPRRIPESLRQQLEETCPEQGSYLADHLQGALPAISLVSQTGLISAFSNDVAADMAFAQQVYGYGRPGDTLLGISTSGSSPNVLRAFQVAHALGLHTLGLTGQSGGELRSLCNVTICVPWQQTADIQERHMAVYHTLCAMLEQAFFCEVSHAAGRR